MLRGSPTAASPLTTSSVSSSLLRSSTLSTLVVPFRRAENCQSIWCSSASPDSSRTIRLKSATVSVFCTSIVVARSHRTKSTSLCESSSPSNTSFALIMSGRRSSSSSSILNRLCRYSGMSSARKGASRVCISLLRTYTSMYALLNRAYLCTGPLLLPIPPPAGSSLQPKLHVIASSGVARDTVSSLNLNQSSPLQSGRTNEK
mmetsp:Transcript_20387/g.47091  ORF Transcript_20387/g.47091 Transcript_20387/m.47091 type:complete len:203 (-) Transcript_20387:164-772(-)